MKKEYDLAKLERRVGKVAASQEAAKVAISLRVDGGVLASLKTEAARMGLPYQTLIGSILHQYVSGELIDAKTVDILRRMKSA
jgi:predicted DNA binding CopG/RHH family protein